MAKGAANEQVMGDLHQKVAQVFIRILDEYEKAAAIPFDADAETAEPLGSEPNSAMLGAITKFLKDNSIAFDTEEIQQLTDTQQRLNARRARRGNLVGLGNLALVEPDE